MSFIDHLTSLTSPQANSSSNILDVIAQWERVNGDVEAALDSSLDLVLSEDVQSRRSVLDLFDDSVEPAQGHLDNVVKLDHVIAQLHNKQDWAPLLPALAQILLSNKEDDVASTDAVELLGFEELDLVARIIKHRRVVGQQLKDFDGNTIQQAHSAFRHRELRQKKHGKGGKHRELDDGRVKFTAEQARQRFETSLQDAASRPLFSSEAHAQAEALPHVYTTASLSGNFLSFTGSKFVLPLGTTREEDDECEEVTIPPSKPVPPKITEKLINVVDLDVLGRNSFPEYTTLNRIQSIVYPEAYTTNGNMLVCAPTGAGKTDVAMLTILRVVHQHLHDPPGSDMAKAVQKDKFKIIYVAPMKALASEITRKMGKRLAWLSIRVRELTGDMQLTRAEIAETQIIVTTPEKWDVVTRKPTGEGELASKVKLLIIDEVHLLNEERGAVIETIVARTLRQVESSQSVIRIVGLSATLPNYVDVAEFLGVPLKTGLFFFDSSFRPVPLEQHFIGVKGKAGTQASRRNMDKVAFRKVKHLVSEGHQVMIFVHSRRDTVKTAEAMKELATIDGCLDDFDGSEHPQYGIFRRELGTSKNKEMKLLFDSGFGIHHAGMLRSDRNMMERMFGARAIKVLCCTATLAWGVNLPAHAVVIKGTQVYDSSRSAFIDLSVLDVLQIFGRAGRPGMETSGEGYICTTHDKLDHYLDVVVAQHAIESKFNTGIADSLNAEIALGTVGSIWEGVSWLGYTYMFVRMKKNPMVYGINHDSRLVDPDLSAQRRDYINAAANSLVATKMIQLDKATEAFTITDRGRIAAKYYVQRGTIETFNKEMRPKMTEADLLRMLCMSNEFKQIRMRETEAKELKALLEGDMIPCDVKGGTDTDVGKVNILLQAYISKSPIEDFALVSDTAYVAQNAGRILRCLVEIALALKWAGVTAVLMAMSKAVERRIWPYDHPLKQLAPSRDAELMYNLTRWADELTVPEIASMKASELGALIHLNEGHGERLVRMARRFPTAKLSYTLKPIASDILKIQVTAESSFEWSSEQHGTSELFWVWVEDLEGENILQWSSLAFQRSNQVLTVDFVIHLSPSNRPPLVRLRLVFDRWIGAEEEVDISFNTLIMPAISAADTPLFDLPLLSVSSLRDSAFGTPWSSSFSAFNGIQTQCYWAIKNSSTNILLCGPSGEGKTTIGQLGIERVFAKNRSSNVLVLTPRASMAKALARNLIPLRQKYGVKTGFYKVAESLEELKGSSTACVTTPNCIVEAYDRGIIQVVVRKLALIVLDDLHLLNSEYELAIALLLRETQTLPVRIIGLSDYLNDPLDLAQWLRVPTEARYSFHPSTRGQPLITTPHPFTIPHSPTLLKVMVKPTYKLVRDVEGGIVFVPSKGQCHQVAADFITQCALDSRPYGFIQSGALLDNLEPLMATLRDPALKELAMNGIGIFHTSIDHADQRLIHELYKQCIIRVLLVPRESCWTLPVHAAVVVVMGTQYIRLDNQGGRQLLDYTPVELVRMQGYASHSDKPGEFRLLCQAEDCDTFQWYLHSGLPLESELLASEGLRNWVQLRMKDGTMSRKQDVMDFLGFTFLFRRLETNPTFYHTEVDGRQEGLSRFVDSLWEVQEVELMPTQPPSTSNTTLKPPTSTPAS